MKSTRPKQQHSVGELVSAAYEQASQITSNRQVAALVASKILESWLARSNRPDLVAQLQATAA
jgi:hypothetical protein